MVQAHTRNTQFKKTPPPKAISPAKRMATSITVMQAYENGSQQIMLQFAAVGRSLYQYIL